MILFSHVRSSYAACLRVQAIAERSQAARTGRDGDDARARLAKALGLSVYQLDKVIRDWIATGCLAKERRHRGIRIEVLA